MAYKVAFLGLMIAVVNAGFQTAFQIATNENPLQRIQIILPHTSTQLSASPSQQIFQHGGTSPRQYAVGTLDGSEIRVPASQAPIPFQLAESLLQLAAQSQYTTSAAQYQHPPSQFTPGPFQVRASVAAPRPVYFFAQETPTTVAPIQVSTPSVENSTHKLTSPIHPVQYSSNPIRQAEPTDYTPIDRINKVSHPFATGSLQVIAARPVYFFPQGTPTTAAPIQVAVPSVENSSPKLTSPVQYSSNPVQQAAPTVYTPIDRMNKVSEQDDFDPDPEYVYGYDIEDTQTGDNKSQSEHRQGNFVQGSYTVIDPDGFKRTVEYTADSVNGFRAIVRREPVQTKVFAPAVSKVSNVPNTS